MANNMAVGKAEISGYALILDQNNMPYIKNPKETPDRIWRGLTDEQKNFANNRVLEEFRRND